MKRLIILLLVVLLPSLCFGRSIKFLIITDLEKQTQNVAITDSKNLARKVCTLKMHNGTIFVEDNKKVLVELVMYINIAIGKINLGYGGKEFGCAETGVQIVESAVFNNFQVTFIEEELIGKSN